MFLSFLLTTLLSFSVLSTRCHAGPPAFSWRFNSNVSDLHPILRLPACLTLSQFVSTSLSECQKLGISVISLNNDSVSFGVPPYYLMALEVDGTPTTTPVGQNRTNLSWVVRHRAGMSSFPNYVLVISMKINARSDLDVGNGRFERQCRRNRSNSIFRNL